MNNPIPVGDRHRLVPRCVVIAAGLLWAAQGASAIGFSTLVSDNHSSPDVHGVGVDIDAFAFSSTLSWSVPSVGQTMAVASHRAAFASGMASLAFGIPFPVLSWDQQLSYTVGFRIDDPDNLGYRVDVQSLLRGYLTAETGPNSTFVSMTGVAMNALVDSGSGFVPAHALDTPSQSLTFFGGNKSVNTLLSASALLDLGAFVGSRDFAIRFEPVDDNLRLRLDNIGTGQVGLRFGLNPGLDELNELAYPGSDGERASEHGHFLTVRATYNLPAVPEPTTWALLAGGLAGVLWRRRLNGSLS